ncbi:hypothetical protein KJ973_03290 [Patescibacteria group bacterium]|nr:hypothetical protein [Patescibacteria group bacterium]MBU1519689.1 hypothetical protein [Patescibacteria group bacterium]MBU1956723.1 hypothetical protein [Patescibacteria group bacterium]MBU2010197.1 hypothetical protein [Patescibacteria group bacterium]MBU2416496.1 hypothetical protein [Patescibacteria group bacterium]
MSAQEIERRAKNLAECEVGWWKAHHRDQIKLMTENMTKLYSLQFGLDMKTARNIVISRVTAALWHNVAEEEEDNNKEATSNYYWNKVNENLFQHFKELLNAQK